MAGTFSINHLCEKDIGSLVKHWDTSLNSIEEVPPPPLKVGWV
jgi:hypothetical protein